MREKIVLSEDVLDIMIKMSEGNSGAATVLTALLAVADYDNYDKNFLLVLNLDDMNIRGSQIWVGFKDHCNSDMDWFKRAIMARDPDMVETINAACEGEEKAVVSGGSWKHGRTGREYDS